MMFSIKALIKSDETKNAAMLNWPIQNQWLCWWEMWGLMQMYTGNMLRRHKKDPIDPKQLLSCEIVYSKEQPVGD